MKWEGDCGVNKGVVECPLDNNRKIYSFGKCEKTHFILWKSVGRYFGKKNLK
jgi:hypothetical protein